MIKLFSSKTGKALIGAAVDEYVKSNDNELTNDAADIIKELL